MAKGEGLYDMRSALCDKGPSELSVHTYRMVIHGGYNQLHLNG